MAKEIKFGADARAALEAGVNKLADTDKVKRKKRCSRQIFWVSIDHKRWCYDRKRY